MTRMGTERYTEGEYLQHNPDWHVGDSPWKANQIIEMLARHQLQPASICEVGCGAGEILRQLHDRLDYRPMLTGYEISPQALELAQPRTTDRLTFRLEDILDDEEATFDLMLVMDVIEHLEDYHAFLRRLHPHSPMTLLHIPLELSVNSVLRPGMLIEHRQTLGHLHFFTESTALDMLESLGYRIVDWTYTAASSTSSVTRWRALTRKQKLLEHARRLLFPRSPAAAARLFGGYSMLVLAR